MSQVNHNLKNLQRISQLRSCDLDKARAFCEHVQSLCLRSTPSFRLIAEALESCAKKNGHYTDKDVADVAQKLVEVERIKITSANQASNHHTQPASEAIKAAPVKHTPLITPQQEFPVNLSYRAGGASASIQKQDGDLAKENEILRAKLLEMEKRIEHLQSGIATEQASGQAPIEIIPSDGLEFNPDFEKAFTLMEESDRCVFVTGKAGTGKSTLLRHFADNTSKTIVLLAYTGIAAINIGGQTIHSFFGFGRKPVLTREDIKVSRKQALFKGLDAIVIDEASMVRADMMDAIDMFMRLNGRDENQPFGGAQVILFGDLYQLPPVVKPRETPPDYFSRVYRSRFFFGAKVFDELDVTVVELKKVYRQKDKAFLDLLNAVRTNTALPSHIARLNQRYGCVPSENVTCITLTTQREPAFEVNQQKLAQLPLPEFVYEAGVWGEMLDGDFPADDPLKLRVGAQVMFVRNDMQHRWVNGTFGKVVGLTGDGIEVEVDSGERREVWKVDRETWDIEKYQFDHVRQTVTMEKVGSFTQYPLKLAWAITIHKSQGLTLDSVMIDLGRGAFDSGQTYVALSRCRSFNGVYLRRPINVTDIKVDSSVRDFFESVHIFE